MFLIYKNRFKHVHEQKKQDFNQKIGLAATSTKKKRFGVKKCHHRRKLLGRFQSWCQKRYNLAQSWITLQNTACVQHIKWKIRVEYPDLSISNRRAQFLWLSQTSCIVELRRPAALTMNTSHNEQPELLVMLYRVCTFLSSKFIIGVSRFDKTFMTIKHLWQHAISQRKSSFCLTGNHVAQVFSVTCPYGARCIASKNFYTVTFPRALWPCHTHQELYIRTPWPQFSFQVLMAYLREINGFSTFCDATGIQCATFAAFQKSFCPENVSATST